MTEPLLIVDARLPDGTRVDVSIVASSLSTQNGMRDRP